MTHFPIIAAATILAAIAPVSAAIAQDDVTAETGGFDISATATIVSDYRFRGVSLSDRDPAPQGSIDLAYRGFYAGVWASTIERFADTNVEADIYAGYAGTAGALGYSVGAIAYLYPGGDGSGDIYEATGTVSTTIGPVEFELAGFYAPDQDNLDGDNLYLSLGASAGIPGTPLTVAAQAGRERGSFYGDKHDWSLGIEYTRGPFTLGAAYHDTDLGPVESGLGRRVKAGLVFSAGASF